MDSDEERKFEQILRDDDEDDCAESYSVVDVDDDYGDGGGGETEIDTDGGDEVIQRAAFFVERYLRSSSAGGAARPSSGAGRRLKGGGRGRSGARPGGRRKKRRIRAESSPFATNEDGGDTEPLTGEVQGGGSSGGGHDRVGPIVLAFGACAVALILAAREFWRNDWRGDRGGSAPLRDYDDYDDDMYYSGSRRPKIHTFFERIDQETGMSDEANEALLSAWKSAWSDAGWDPIVLTMEDVRRHPDYDEMIDILESGGKGFLFGPYDEMCFLRWIAMGAPPEYEEGNEEDLWMSEYDLGDGGGWMSDYDVFPLAPVAEEGWPDSLPNGGRLTVHEAHWGTRKSVVPSLVSGTAEEWTRMAWRLIKNYEAHEHEEFWSDMFALDDIGSSYFYHIVSEGGKSQSKDDEEEEIIAPFEIQDSVLEASDVLKGDRWKDRVDCKKTRRKRAVHFSHESFYKDSVLRPGEGLSDRGPIALHWLEWWRERCHT
mmetsp:Transcript_46999/g.142305  ORF Transcript_46999/g.142305 Transcript_46999/m.142305 type:complete len:486 (-) Transcript_46999:116-1573(-)